MAITIPWLSKGSAASGRIGLAIGPDGLALAYVDAAGHMSHCQFHAEPGDSRHLLEELVEQQGWQRTPCSIVLHPVYYQLLLAEKPPVEAAELASAIRWKVKELLDYPLEEAAIEHFQLPEDAYRGRQKMLYVAALRKASLQGLVEPVESCGLTVDCVEVAELALHNIISRLPQEGGGTALLQLHEGEGFINLVENGAIYLTRRVDIGLEKYQPNGDNLAFFDALYLEIQRSLDYYESQLGKGIITRLYYSPGLADTSAIGEFLSTQLGLNVAPLSLGDQDWFSGEFDEEAVRCMSAIGAALGPYQQGEVMSAAS